MREKRPTSAVRIKPLVLPLNRQPQTALCPETFNLKMCNIDLISKTKIYVFLVYILRLTLIFVYFYVLVYFFLPSAS